MNVLPTLWPGWTVAWALFGVVDLARSLGWETARVLDPPALVLRLLLEGWPGISEEWLLGSLVPEGVATVLTIRWNTGEIGDYRFASRQITDRSGTHYFAAVPYQLLSLGPSLLPLLRSQPTAVLPKESSERGPKGAYVDEEARTIWVGANAGLDPRELEAIALRWPGWQVQGHAEGLVGQVRLSGRDPSALMVPSQQAIEELIAELTRENGFDPGALFQALSQGGKPVTVGKGFFSQDASPLVRINRSCSHP